MHARPTGRTAGGTYTLRASGTFLAISGTLGHRSILQDSPAKSGTVGKYDVARAAYAYMVAGIPPSC